MKREEVESILLKQKEDNDWFPVEVFKINEELEPVNLHNTVFNAKEDLFMQRFCIAGHSMDLYMGIKDGKFDFAVKCDFNNEKWFTSDNPKECIKKARKWLEKKNR